MNDVKQIEVGDVVWTSFRRLCRITDIDEEKQLARVVWSYVPSHDYHTEPEEAIKEIEEWVCFDEIIDVERDGDK